MPTHTQRDLPIAETLRDLLAGLPLWQEERDRRAFLELTLHGHPALADFQFGGKPLTVAAELVNRLRAHDYRALPDPAAAPPVCALIREIRTRREDGNRDTAERSAVLARFFGCDPPPRVALDGSPYPGLMAYDWGGQHRDRARLFFGREPETLDLLERLRDPAAGRLLIVSGASGSGKSSLVKAGLWRALAEPPDPQDPTPEPIPGCRDWVISAMTPTGDGDPFFTLVNSVREHWREGRLRPAEAARRLRTDPATFPEFLHQLLHGRPVWLLILDQLEEIFTPAADTDRDAFIDLLLRAVEEPHMRVIATLRSDFLPQVIAHAGLCRAQNRGGYGLGAPGPLALARMIEGPAQAVGLAIEPQLTAQLVQEADREPGGLALLAAALQDIGLAAGDDRTLQLACYREVVGGLAGVLSTRAERGLALLGDEGPAALPRVFAHLVHIDPETGAATRRRAPLAQWPADSAERRLIDCFARDADRPQDAVRLLVCDRGRGGEPTVEVAHEALLREWPRLTLWIRTQREALIRRDEVLRDAARWDARGRPDTLLPHPDVVAEVRAKFAEAGLWDELRGDDRVAYFLARDDVADLRDLTLGAFERCGAAGASAALAQLLWLTAAGRTWETRAAFGRWAVAQAPALADWLRAGLAAVLDLLGQDDALPWHQRRPGIGDLLAALGDDRPGVGLGADGLPDPAWIEIADQPLRIARYPITNAQYQAFIDAPDYDNPDWWQEGYLGPTPADPRWAQPNRPRVTVAWVEALAFCRWLTARYRAAGLIGADTLVRLPTEAEWENAAGGPDGRDYPWGTGYRVGYANVDERYDQTGPYKLDQTTAVGLYPQGVSPAGLLDCAGNVWEWCLNKYENPADMDTKSDAARALRGGSWDNNPASARVVYRHRLNPTARNNTVGFRVVCACPIPLNTDPLVTEH